VRETERQRDRERRRKREREGGRATNGEREKETEKERERERERERQGPLLQPRQRMVAARLLQVKILESQLAARFAVQITEELTFENVYQRGQGFQIRHGNPARQLPGTNSQEPARYSIPCVKSLQS